MKTKTTKLTAAASLAAARAELARYLANPGMFPSPAVAASVIADCRRQVAKYS